MSKKVKIGLSIGVSFFIILFIIVFFITKQNNYNNNSTLTNISISNIMGTWYSDKPDSLTLTQNGNYSFSAWNGGNPWLTFPGTYTIKDDSVILENELDGTTILHIIIKDGNIILSGKYNYYKTESEAKAALSSISKQKSKDKKNTINDLVGEWISLDGTTKCIITDKNYTIHFLGSDTMPEEVLEYEYEILNDKKIVITENENRSTVYSYKLYEEDGVLYFVSPIKEYASTYQKADDQTYEHSTKLNKNVNTIAQPIHKVISVEKNPDKSEYTAELSSYVEENLIGTWKGTFDEWPNENSLYWSYTFDKDGKYTFSDGENIENGTYTIISDPNNNYYHSQITLMNKNGDSRTIQFYFVINNPMKMITDDQNDPTFKKQ